MSVAACFFVGVSYAFAQSADGADDVTQTINAEIQLTQTHIQNVVSKMGESFSNPYPDPEYGPLTKDFEKKVEQALANYEASIQNVFLPKVQYWLNRFASSRQLGGNKKSERVSPDGKEEESQYVVEEAALAQEQLTLLHVEYVKLISKLYSDVFGEIPVKLELMSDPLEKKECRGASRGAFRRIIALTFASGKILSLSEATLTCYETDGRLINSKGIVRGSPSSDGLSQLEFNLPLVQDIIDKSYNYGCQSKTCRQLRGADFDQYILLVSKLIDLPMEFKVGDKKFSISKSGLLPVRVIDGGVQ